MTTNSPNLDRTTGSTVGIPLGLNDRPSFLKGFGSSPLLPNGHSNLLQEPNVQYFSPRTADATYSPSPEMGGAFMDSTIVSPQQSQDAPQQPPPLQQQQPQPPHQRSPVVGQEMFSKGATSIDTLSIEEIQARKSFIRSHRLLGSLLTLLTECKKEGIIPPIQSTSLFQHPLPGSLDFSLEDFLQSQGILENDESMDEGDSSDHQEFFAKLSQLRQAYVEELEKLNKVCTEFCSRMMNLLREQSQIRPVTEEEIQMKIAGIQQKFDYVRNQLRTNVCNAILVLQKQYHHPAKRKRRNLSKRATEILSGWFYDHIDDPYPTDEEKSMLATQCVLSLNQVNNWFGNKRIRYKRKCLEDEAKRSQKMMGTLPGEAQQQQSQESPIPSPASQQDLTPSQNINGLQQQGALSPSTNPPPLEPTPLEESFEPSPATLPEQVSVDALEQVLPHENNELSQAVHDPSGSLPIAPVTPIVDAGVILSLKEEPAVE